MVTIDLSIKFILKPFGTAPSYEKTTAVRAGVWVINLPQESLLKIR